MKGPLLSLLLVCSSAAPSMAATAVADAKQQVLDVTEAWVAAENKHDAAALGRILDDKFISTYAANKPIGKAAFIKGITKGEVDPTQSQSLTESVVIEGDTAVIVGTDTFHSTAKPPVTPPLRFTITYVHRDGRWQALAEHIVAIPRTQ